METDHDLSIQHSSADNLPTLSSTSPINTALSDASNQRISPFHRKSRSSTEASNTELRDNAARDVKRFLRDNIREDWEYDPVSPAPSLVPSAYDVWRSRDADSSESEAERDTTWRQESNPYKFDSPDAIESSILERRRKRRRLLKDEMAWNTGLRVWSQRRDAWSGARHKARPQAVAGGLGTQQLANGETSQRYGLSGNGGIDHDPDSSDHISTSTSRSSLSAAPYVNKQTTITATQSSTSDSEPLVPVAPPLIPATNPIRASIMPSIYPSIYSKVILQSLTPTVPMNLGDVTRAIVQGWKDEGQWPPQSSVVADAKKDVQSLKKKAENAEKGRVRKGVGVVRKALGLTLTVE